MEKTIRNATVSTMALIITLAVNALANILPINNMTTGQISALYPSLFTPAGITFSIWSLIYVLLIGFVLLQWIKNDLYVFMQISGWFWFTCVLNSAWILVWHYQLPGLSVVVMLLLLVVTVQLFIKLRKIAMPSLAEKIFIRLPFTIYFAWICVATIANISAFLVSVNWSGAFLSSESWTVLMMAIATALAVVVAVKFYSPAFALVVTWALVGIFLRWQSTEYAAVGTAALVCVGITVLAASQAAYKLLPKKRQAPGMP
jgi:translocator protein